MHLSAQVVSIIGALPVPFLTAALTHSKAPAWVKGIVSIVLSSAVGLVVTATGSDGTAVLSQDALINCAISTATAIGSYLGLWQGAGINSVILPNTGIGAPAPQPLPSPLTAEDIAQLTAILAKLAPK
jgi:hypothetical protein